MADANGTFTITWKTPQRVREYQRSELIKLAKKRFLPCWLKITIICIGVYFILRPINHILPEKLLIVLLGGMPLYAGCLIGSIYWGPVLLSYFPTKNTINHKGVYLHNASQSILFPWKKISGYYIRYDEPTETSILEFDLPKRKKRRIIYLPDGPDAKNIVDIVAQRLPVLSSWKQETPGKGELSSLEQAFFEGLTVLLAYVGAKLSLDTMNKNWLSIALLCLMVFGSGTIGFIIRRGLTFWRNPYYVSLAFAYNLCTSMVFMLWIAILMLYRLAEKIPAN